MRSKEKVQRLVFEILNILKEKKHEGPLGARKVAKELHERGFDIGERAVRYHLKHLDDKGFTEKPGSLKGRVITEKGEEEAKKELVGERVGFVIGKIEELIYEMSYTLETGEGTIISNISTINSEDREEALSAMAKVMKEGYAPSPLIKISEEGETIGRFEVPEGKTSIATICSVTIDGLLANGGIPLTPKTGGVLEIENGKPQRFIEAIAYQGSSLDPLQVFTSRKMTSYSDLFKKESGRILANLREIPIPARSSAQEIIKEAEERDLNGVIRVGSPAESIFGLPVDVNKVGIVVAGGINSGAVVEEKGIEIETTPMEVLLDISKLRHIQELL